MIDPRALQQHFRKVQQRQEPKQVPVPRISYPKPLTAIEAIPVPEPIIEQEDLSDPTPNKEPINLVIEVPPPIGDLVVDEIEEGDFLETEDPKPEEVLEVEETKEKAEPKTENPYGYSALKQREEDYDPYGYYSGPRF